MSIKCSSNCSTVSYIPFCIKHEELSKRITHKVTSYLNILKDHRKTHGFSNSYIIIWILPKKNKTIRNKCLEKRKINTFLMVILERLHSIVYRVCF